jgi:hypothetical protein
MNVDAMFNEKSVAFLTMVKKLEHVKCEDIKPNGGGKQISLRIDPLTVLKVDEIANRIGWSRSDVMVVLLCKGLHFMYERLNREVLESLARSLYETTGGER